MGWGGSLLHLCIILLDYILQFNATSSCAALFFFCFFFAFPPNIHPLVTTNDSIRELG